MTNSDAVPPASAPAATAEEQHFAVMEEGHKLTGDYIREHFVDEDDDQPAATAGTEPLVIADPSVPRNEVHFRDARGKTVGKIVNLAPAAPTGEEAETGCECSMSSSPYPEPNADGSCPLCGKRSRRVAVETLDYPAAARSIALNLAEFCDESLAYPEMIAEAARQAATELAALREALDDERREHALTTAAWKSEARSLAASIVESDTALAALRARETELRDSLTAMVGSYDALYKHAKAHWKEAAVTRVLDGTFMGAIEKARAALAHETTGGRDA